MWYYGTMSDEYHEWYYITVWCYSIVWYCRTLITTEVLYKISSVLAPKDLEGNICFD